MKSNQIIFIALSLIIGSILGYMFRDYEYDHTNKGATTGKNYVSETAECNGLFEMKKAKYWNEEIGQYNAIYSPSLKTCLALNIYYNSQTKDYLANVVDMSNDKTLLYYSDDYGGYYVEGDKRINCSNSYATYFKHINNGNEEVEQGCERHDLLYKMFERIEGYGFVGHF